ncbi:hypothetical protein LW979_17555, partial [Erwinia amylovora]|uniref:phage major capsid protein n=1 Tax=Erwinia amylovora TaxID=552 RepID=UPI0037BF9AE7|nr:hypothetical protein [Erwinia amylovora]
LPTGHQITQVGTALPSAAWRKINAGVPATKIDTEQFVEACGILEDESKVDRDLAALKGDQAAYRKKTDDVKREGIAQQFATATFYESA